MKAFVRTTDLEVAQLREGLVAVVKAAHKGFLVGVCDLVRPHVAALCEALAALVAGERLLARMAALVRAKVAELREPLAAAEFLAHKGLDAGVCPSVNLEVGLLVE